MSHDVPCGQASWNTPPFVISPSPHSNPATSASCLSLPQSPEPLPRCGPGTVSLGTHLHIFEDLSLICSQSAPCRPPPVHCSLSVVPMPWMQDSTCPSPKGEVPVSTSFEIVLNTHRPEEMAQCAGSTKPGLFLARYLANRYSESSSYRKLLDDQACLFACLLV